MTKLNSDEIIKELNKLQKYDLFGDYDHYIDKAVEGEYLQFDDVEDMIKDMISND